MIVRNEGATIERALGCARLFADEMVVVDTGSTDETVAKAEAMGAKVHHFRWIEDFAAARNYSFSQCAMDWILWLDGDDVISPEDQNRILDLKSGVLNDELQAIYLRYNYPPFRQWRERIARRDLFAENKLRWQNPVHEFIDGIDGQKAKYFDAISILHSTPPDRHALKKDRNISILRKHYASGATDDRSLYIYAVECLHSLLRDEETGPNRKVDGVVRWRRTDLKRVIAEKFGVDDHQRYVGKLLKKLGFSHISARPRHPAQDERIVELSKKLPARLGRPSRRVAGDDAGRNPVSGRSPHRPEERPRAARGQARNPASPSLRVCHSSPIDGYGSTPLQWKSSFMSTLPES